MVLPLDPLYPLDPQQDQAVYPFDPTQQTGELQRRRPSILGGGGEIKPPEPAKDTFDFLFMKDKEPETEPAAEPAPSGGPIQAPYPVQQPAAQQQPDLPGGGLVGALNNLGGALSEQQAGELRRAGVVVPVETTKVVTTLPNGQVGPSEPVRKLKDRTDYTNELALAIEEQRANPTEAGLIHLKELQGHISRIDEAGKAAREKEAYDNYFREQQRIDEERRALREVTYANAYKERKEKIQALEEKLANAPTGMEGKDWAVFLGLGLLSGLAKGAGMGQRNKPGLIMKFADMWAQNQVNSKERQIELYKLGITNARNDLQDLHQELGNMDEAKNIMLGSLKARLARDLQGVASDYPGSEQKAAGAVMDISKSLLEHAQKKDADLVKYAKGKTDIESAKFDLAIKRRQLGPQVNPEMVKDQQQSREMDSVLKSLWAAPEDQREALAKQYKVEVPKEALKSDDAWHDYLNRVRQIYGNSLRAKYGIQTGGAAPAADPSAQQVR